MAKRLRRELTFTEKLLWAELRKLPLHVRKQSPVGPYVADFLIHSAKLVIEVDGLRHGIEEAQLHDAVRDAWLASEGYRVVRFTDNAVIADAESVARRILQLTLPRSPRGKGE